MQTSLVCLCLCLLSTALATPIQKGKLLPMQLIKKLWVLVIPHQIILKGCNAKHGVLIFRYIYSRSAQRKQTQIK
ncbi:OC116 protein, partial [Illadopsis cleaveri]|nr:OC116 protein [Illadopsis cleaveri]